MEKNSERVVLLTLCVLGFYVGWNLTPSRKAADPVVASTPASCPCKAPALPAAPKPFRVNCTRCGQGLIVTPPSAPTGEIGQAVYESTLPDSE